MKHYQVKSADTSHFWLTQDDPEIGRLEYDSGFSFKAKITLADHAQYAVQPKGFWGTTIEIKEQEQVLLDFQMDWKGQILVRTAFDADEAYCIFKQKGLLKNTFLLLDQEKMELLNIEPDFKWSSMNDSYQLVASDAFEQLPRKELLLLMAVHCANYYVNMMASAVAM
ncbi:MAG: hypothetical protein M3Y12_13195 [Bacteroidota bacterium]|nr:hypothetical protein [Bacteroidota bacterium]